MPGPTPTAMEDYVKVIYAHTEWQSQPITTNALAARLGLAASSVTEMVKKLTAQGLAHHEPYGAIELTERGRTLALTMVRRTASSRPGWSSASATGGTRCTTRPRCSSTR